ncbi:MGMT family protein [Dehalobacter sp. DCM]|uniref:MGMT family protein n=1 Tax=Dehalobacter sp. DCM TaxID=2907827 RepID=UPI0030817ED2|nr:MGMT family protein [Dehalobacter sp. DCM]
MGIDYKKIQQLVAAIPPGKVATYGQIALWAGCPRNARVVVWAMRAASPQIKLPCHRVVNRTGRLAKNLSFLSFLCPLRNKV